MQTLATMAQMKHLDRTAIRDLGIPSLDLMERAAQATADAVRELLEQRGQTCVARTGAVRLGTLAGGSCTPQEMETMSQMRQVIRSRGSDPYARVALLCGPGNNGGDGIAAARLLLNLGFRVRAFLVGDRTKMTPDARAMEQRLMDAGGVLEPFCPESEEQEQWMNTCDCFVDALFGVGLERPVEGAFRVAVERMNRARCPVVSCDVPSGIHGDTGEVLGVAVRATATVTFTCAKPGLYLGEGGPCTGQIRVVDIGIPPELVQEQIAGPVVRGQTVQPGDFPLPKRPRTAHKGDFGKLFLLAGARGYTGAPVLCSQAAVRTGVGLVYLGVPEEIYPIVAVKCDEAMPFPLSTPGAALEKAKGCDAAVIGPGLGRRPETRELVCLLLEQLDIPVILDADGINALTGHIDVLDKRTAPTVLTPHEGEFQRLTGCQIPIQDRMAAARNFAGEHGCTLVLKGHRTVTAASDGRVWINTTGNPGMAKGGSGDVLAGMLAALLGQRHIIDAWGGLEETVAAGVLYHGMAGDRCADRLGEYAMTPTDLIMTLPEVLR